MVHSRLRKMLPNLTLVLGGAASGKSEFSENFILFSTLMPIYLATGQSFDAEMDEKIILHKIRRGPEWGLIEAPLDMIPAFESCKPGQAILLDCATMWLSNWLMAEQDPQTAPDQFLAEVAHSPAPVVVVSNEVGQGIVPDNALARSFREAQGRLNIAIAAKAELVIQVTAGLPQVLKGKIP